MIQTILLLNVAFIFSLNSAQAMESYFKHQNHLGGVVYVMAVKGGIQISATKSCMSQQCRASQIAQGKIQFPTRASLENQAHTLDSALCHAFKGVEEAVYLPDDTQIPICRFNDQSFIFSSDLMRLYNGGR